MSRGALVHAERPAAARGKPAAAIPARSRATGAHPVLLDEALPAPLPRRAAGRGGSAPGFRFGTLPLPAPGAPALQAKLKVSRPGDKYEQEAERVADAVLRMPDPSRKPDRPTAGAGRASLQRADEPEVKALYRRPEREEGEAQANPKTLPGGPRNLSPRLQDRIGALKGSGKPLPDSSREFFEPRFGHDFSRVRVHTDHRAAETAREVGARAFTVGRDVVFGAGQYQPGSSEGKRLLAHELTHTIQQGAGARRAARRLAALTLSPATAQVQRAEGEDNEEEGGWLVRKIAGVAKYIPGFTLVTSIIGKNPITGGAVNRTPKNLLRGVMGLIPGGEALFSRLDKSGAIDAAFTWLSKEIAKLGITWAGVKALFAQAWDEMSIWKGISGNLAILKRVFGPTVKKLIVFAGRVGKKVLSFIFEGTLRLFGAPVKKIMGVLNKGPSVIGTIVKNPIGFLGNLVAALKKGVSQFSANIWKHLKAGLVKWLFGTLSKAGITLPETFNLKGVFTLVAQILGLTWENIRPKIVKAIGEPAMQKLETAWDYIKTLITGGPAALWERIKEDLTSLKATVMGAIKSWVVTTIVKAAITKLAAMFNPVGAIIEAVRGIYNTVMFFIERAKQIAALVNAVLNSIAKIAAGNITAAANWIEASMARAIPVLLGFLARLIGLGGLSEKIRETIAKVRAPIDKALDKVIGFIAKKAKAVLAKGKAGVAKGKAAVKAGVAKVAGFIFPKKTFKAGKESHTMYFEGKDKASKLMVSSSPKSFEEFINGLNGNPSKVQEAKGMFQAIEKWRGDLNGASSLKAKNKDKTSKEKALYKNINEKMDKLAEKLAELIGPGQTGATENNPILLEWPKRASKIYVELYLPAQNPPIDVQQGELKTIFEGNKQISRKRDLDDKLKIVNSGGIPIEKFSPHGDKSLPGTTDNIGISEKNRTFVGKTLEVTKVGFDQSTGGGHKLNDKLKKYGYSPSAENADADHVIERQIGGEDAIPNLWPLNKSENRSSGSRIRHLQKLTTPATPKKKAQQIADENTDKKVYFRIKRTLS